MQKEKSETSCDHLKYTTTTDAIKMDPVAANHFLKCIQVLISLPQHSADPKTPRFRGRKLYILVKKRKTHHLLVDGVLVTVLIS